MHISILPSNKMRLQKQQKKDKKGGDNLSVVLLL